MIEQKLNQIRLLFNTIKFLKPVQVYGRIWFRLYHPNPDLSRQPALRIVSGQWVAPISKPQSLSQPWRFFFLNVEHECQFPEDWNNNALDKLWLFNLHYFDDLQGRDTEQRREIHDLLIGQWVRDNSPGYGNGWEPYPLSLRIVNWIKWVMGGNQLSDEALHSLAVQIRYLFKRIEYHFLGNHLFTNAKALLFGGLFFQGAEAEKWLACALRILEKEIPEQILEDGGHFELSPMYHSIILEDILDLINIMGVYQVAAPKLWREKAHDMLQWLNMMCHPDGNIALFNDAALSIASRPDKIHDYSARLGFKEVRENDIGLNTLTNSGYVCCRKNIMVALLDVGAIGPEYLTAHSHADTLSFELSLFGRRVIVDSGTSCYGMGAERDKQRGTLSHNTVCIDGQNSSEVWSGFRVANRAKPVNLEVEEKKDKVRVRCGHDGYDRLPGGVIHTREWVLEDGKMVTEDTIAGIFKKAQSRFHFHPDIEPITLQSGKKGEAILNDGKKIEWLITGGIGQIIKTTYHPEFGVSIDNWCLEISIKDKKCRIEFFWPDN